MTPLSISGFKFSQPTELDVSIVIVSFNTREILLNCLESIQKHTEGISYEVIVVDNASEDKTIEAVAERFLSVQVIANDDNRGFSAANNQGIVSSKGKRIAFLNPDTLLTENSFQKIFAYMESHPEYSILGSGIVDENNLPCPIRLWEDTPQDAVFKVLNLYNPSSELRKMGEMKAKEVEVISGCCFVVDRELRLPLPERDKSFINNVLERSDCFQGRIANREQIQIQIDFPQHQEWVDQFRVWWKDGIRMWRSRNKKDATLIFLCELGPRPYAITDKNQEELSDRWEEALTIKSWVEEIWAELEAE